MIPCRFQGMTRVRTTTMSDAPDEARMPQAQFDRIIQETRKFSAEQNKLAAEAAKLNRDRFFAPFVIVATFGSGLLAAIVTHFIH